MCGANVVTEALRKMKSNCYVDLRTVLGVVACTCEFAGCSTGAFSRSSIWRKRSSSSLPGDSESAVFGVHDQSRSILFLFVLVERAFPK
jgi:hypothetical protein